MILLVIFIFLFFIIITMNLKIVIKITDKRKDIFFKIYILSKICIFKMKLDKKNFIKFNKNQKLKKRAEQIKKNKKAVLKCIYEVIKKINLKVEKLKIYIKISTTDTVLTSYAVAIIASTIALLIQIFKLNIDNKNIDNKNLDYKINPIYNNKFTFNIDFLCIININIVHTIYVIFRNIKKWRCDFYGRTTSNRRAYGNGNE